MKQMEPSLTLQGLEAIQSRLRMEHPLLEYFSVKYSNKLAGIGGEERVVEEFRKHTFCINHRVFHDLSLSSDSQFQIDTLFLTPSYGIIFEVKNISGKLRFIDNPPQLIQIKENGQEKGLDSPAAQVERNCELLSIWLQSRNIHLPLYGVVVLAYPKQIVERPPTKTKILFPNLIPQYIRSLPQKQICLDHTTINWLSNELLNNHKMYIPEPICVTYNIPKSDIRTGVICDLCGLIGMIKTRRGWHCKNCESYDNFAHQKAIKEWFLLFGGKMTNRDCREFLHVDIKTATRILVSMHMRSEGSFRNRSYIMDFE